MQQLPNEVKELVNYLILSKKTELNTDWWNTLQDSMTDSANRQALLINDIHSPLQDFWLTNKRNIDNSREVLSIVSRLSEETAYNYSLAVSGKFLWEGFKHFETLINKDVNNDKILLTIKGKYSHNDLHKVKIGSNIYTAEEIHTIQHKGDYEKNDDFMFDFYELNEMQDWKYEQTKIWMTILDNFLKNEQIVKYLTSGRLDLLKDFLIVLNLLLKSPYTNKKKTGNNFAEEDLVLKAKCYELIDKFFYNENSVKSIITHKFIPHYLFYHLFNSAYYDAQEQHNYIDFLCSIVDKADFVTTKDVVNNSDYITGVLNKFMAEIIFYKNKMGKSIPFSFHSKNLKDMELEQLCDRVVDQFTYCVEKDLLAKNFGVCLRENGFDVLFRYLLFLCEKEYYFSFVKFCCYLIMLVRKKSSEYHLPNLYRNISLFWLQHYFSNKNYLVVVSMIRQMKYFNYTVKQKALLLSILDRVILEGHAEGYLLSMPYNSQQKLLDFLLYNKCIDAFYIENRELESEYYETGLPDDDEDLYNINAARNKLKIQYLSDGPIKDTNEEENQNLDQENYSNSDTESQSKTNPQKPITKPKEDPKQTDQKDLKPEFFGFELLDTNEIDEHEGYVYPFESTKGNTFDYCQDIKGGNCNFCDTFKGFYNIDMEEQMFQAEEQYDRQNIEPHPFTNHTEFAAVDLFFGIFLSSSKRFFIDHLMGFINKMITSKTIDERVKCAWVLYYLHIVLRDKHYSSILLAIDFSEFFVDFFIEFFNNFGLVCFEQNYIYKISGNAFTDENINKIEYQPLMSEVSRKGLNEPKNTRTLVIKNDGENNPLVVDFSKSEPTEFKDIVWDESQKRFMPIRVMLSQKLLGLVRNYNKDDHFESGEYTIYFAKLHTVLHLSNVFVEVIKKSPLKGKKKILSKLGNFSIYIIEISIKFSLYFEAFIAKKPFLPDTECWDDMKDLMKEVSGSLQELLMLILTNDYKMLTTTTDVLANNPEYVKNYLEILGKFASHSATVSYLTNVLIITENILGKDPHTLNYDLGIQAEFFVNLANHLIKFDNSFKNIIRKNEDIMHKNEFHDEKAICIGLKMTILSLQLLNLIGTEDIIQKNKEISIESIINNTISFFGRMLQFSLKLKEKSKRINVSNKNNNQPLLKDKNDKLGTLRVNYINFFKNYAESCAMACWWMSQHSNITLDLVLTSDLFQNISKHVEYYEISNESIFCISCILLNSVKMHKKVDIMEEKFKGFSELLNKLIIHSLRHFVSIEQTLPLLKALRLILTFAPFERARFLKLQTPIIDIKNVVLEQLKHENIPIDTNNLIIDDDKLELSRIDGPEFELAMTYKTKFLMKKNNSFGDTILFDDTRNDDVILKIPYYKATENECKKLIEILRGGEKTQELERKMLKENQLKSPGLMSIETMQGLKAKSSIKQQVANDIFQDFAVAPLRNKKIQEKLLEPFPVSFNTSLGNVKTDASNSLNNFTYFTDENLQPKYNPQSDPEQNTSKVGALRKRINQEKAYNAPAFPDFKANDCNNQTRNSLESLHYFSYSTSKMPHLENSQSQNNIKTNQNSVYNIKDISIKSQKMYNSQSQKSNLGKLGQNVLNHDGSKKLIDQDLYFNDELSKRLAKGYNNKKIEKNDSSRDSNQNMVNRVDAVYNFMMRDKLKI